MPTQTTFFDIVKPFPNEEVNAFTLAYNIQLMSYVIYNLKEMTNPQPSLAVLHKTASLSSTINSTDFRPPTSAEKWVDSWPQWDDKWLIRTAESANTTNGYQFITDNAGGFVAMLVPGYYRISYQIHFTMSGTTANHGTIRACLAFAGEFSNLIPRTYIQVPINTYTATTTLTFQDIIKVVEQNYPGDDYDLMVHGNNSLTFWTTSASVGYPDQKFGVMVGQWNDGGLTATFSGNDSYFSCEFVRSL